MTGRPLDQKAADRRDRHLAVIETLLKRDRVELTGRQLVYLLAHFQANLQFQHQAIKGLASAASGSMDWDTIDRMIEAAERSEELLDKFSFEIADE